MVDIFERREIDVSFRHSKWAAKWAVTPEKKPSNKTVKTHTTDSTVTSVRLRAITGNWASTSTGSTLRDLVIDCARVPATRPAFIIGVVKDVRALTIAPVPAFRFRSLLREGFDGRKGDSKKGDGNGFEKHFQRGRGVERD